MANRIITILLALLMGIPFFYFTEPGNSVYAEQIESAFYVAVDGDDGNAGTMAAPFATLQRAQQAIRDIKMSDGLPTGGITVYLREGDYHFTQTWQIGQADSGEAGSPIVYQSFPGERASLKGGYQLDANRFSLVVDPAVLSRLPEAAQGFVWEYDLVDDGITAYGELPFYGHSMFYVSEIYPELQSGPPASELFFNDEVLTLSRWPNEGFETVASVVRKGSTPRDYYDNPALTEIPYQGFVIGYDGDRPSRWIEAEDIWMYGYWFYDWSDQALQVASIDPQTKQIESRQPSAYGVRNSQRYYVFNLLEEIDVPGEWYLDRTEGKLYVYPPGDIQEANVELSLLDDTLISLTEAEHIHFENLNIETTRGTAMRMTDSSDNRIAGSTFRKIGQQAVNISGGSRNQLFSNDFYDIGAGAIKLDGGDRVTLTPGEHLAENNYFYNFSRIQSTYTPAISLDGVGNKAIRNLIREGPHMGIGYSGNDHLIEGNELFDLVKDTEDAGAIYAGRNWTFQGNQIIRNFIHHLGEKEVTSHGVVGIYHDDQLSGILAADNVLYNIEGRGFLVGGGRDNVFLNNLIVGVGKAMTYDERGLTWSAGAAQQDLLNKLNAMPHQAEPWYSRYPSLAQILSDEPSEPRRSTISGNVMVDTGPMELVSRVSEYGIVEHNVHLSKEADPGFKDPTNYDFSLQVTSAVYDALPTFKNIAFDQIGLYLDEYRQALPQTGSFRLNAPEFLNSELNHFVPALSWQPASGSRSYLVQIAEDESMQTGLQEQVVEEPRLIPDGLAPDKDYFWRVKALPGGKSMTARWNTEGVASFTTQTLELPAVPIIVEGLGIGTSDPRTVIRWEPAQRGEGYRVYRQGPGELDFSLVTELVGALAFTDRDVILSGQYAYRVAAFNAAGESAMSDPVWVTVNLLSLTSVDMVATQTGLGVGETVQIQLQGVGSEGQIPLTGTVDASYTSSDSSIASVNAAGEMTGISPGIAHIEVEMAVAGQANLKHTLTVIVYSEIMAEERFETSVHSDERSRTGQRSAKLVQDQQSTNFTFARLSGVAEAWFYDDGQSSKEAMVSLMTGSTELFRVGAAHHLSDYRIRSMPDTEKIPTSIARSVGWHQVVFDLTDPERRIIYLDGKPVYEDFEAHNGFTRIAGIDYWLDNSISNMFFDDFVAYRVEADRNEGTLGERLPLDPYLEDEGAWDAGAGTLAMQDNVLDFNMHPTQRNSLGYTGRLFNNERLAFRAKLDLSPSWQGFGIRANHPTELAWAGNDQYLIVVKPEQIELQRWAGGQTFLEIVDNDFIKDGVWHNIELAAVQQGNQVAVHFLVDDQEVFHYLDNTPILQPGHFVLQEFSEEGSIQIKGWNDMDSEEDTPAPGNPVLSDDSGHAHGLRDGNYTVAMNMWWGNNGTLFKLYENGQLVEEKELQDFSPQRQTIEVDIQDRVNGTYTYTCELWHADKMTACEPLMVTVTDANPGNPILSHDNWSEASNYTVTMNMWWGTNATEYRLYENGELIEKKALSNNSPRAQQASVARSDQLPGVYEYQAILINSSGETKSETIVVVVSNLK